MKIYTLVRRQTIPRSCTDVFRFFEQADNLERVTPRSVGFRLLTPKPITMAHGTVLDYVIHLLGIPVRWTTYIATYEPPHRFVDVALRGPYSFWHHTHTFHESDGETEMTDEVRYALPLGVIGRIVRALWVRRQLNHIFDYRARVIGEMLKSDAAEEPMLSSQEHNQK